MLRPKFSQLRTILIFSILVSLFSAACSGPADQTQATVDQTEVETQGKIVEPTARPAAAQAITTPENLAFVDGMGRNVSLPGPAQRIVSLAPSNTEILFAIGAGAQVVGRDQFSDYPAETADVENIGGGFEGLNNELVVALKPDLVLASALQAPEQIKALEDLGLTVFVLGNPTDLSGLYANLVLVGQLTGHQAEAQSLAEQLGERETGLIAKLEKVTDKPLVFYELDSTDPSAPWTAGPGTFVDTLIQMAGGRNLGSDLSNAWVQVSLEELIQQNPDLILLGDAQYGGVKPEDVFARLGWEGLKAVKEKQVFVFDDNLVSRPGPRLVDGLEALARQLHPELFK